MKKAFYLLLAVSTFMVSCSDDDSGNNPAASADVYLPLNTGNYWVYDVPGSFQTGRDSLYVANDTVISGTTYTKFKTGSLAYGFFSAALSANGGVRNDGGKLMLTGTTAVNFIEEFPINIPVTNLVILDAGASVNSELGNVSGSFEQVYNELPLTFTYSLATTAKENLESYTIGGETYTDVKRVETKLNLSIGVSFEGSTITLLPAQDVAISSQYYAKDIGMVHVNTTFQYQVSALFASQFTSMFGLPSSGTQTQQEILDTYSVQ
ncbi:hypothetical protein FMM05_05685 [Flavobacterium zepuense]|uniref:Lipoprotein n=1 Tax=Flavobacterium zepuense TaxID=2593302 RepID=A0A552V5F8_9FLAO|nr:hypothetical protein [Flavobacterium zepuense]TRW25713.1 hypothetical protein FMM05_05685 [Flavobacterium zepuense]